MADKPLLDAVRQETERIFHCNDSLWKNIREGMAAELAPLLADLVRQRLIQALSSPQPDHPAVAMKAAVERFAGEWDKDPKGLDHYDTPLSYAVDELLRAAKALPVTKAPTLVYAEAPSGSAVPLIEALCEARYALDQAFQRGPGWEDLARAVSGRIGSELEVRNRG